MLTLTHRPAARTHRPVATKRFTFAGLMHVFALHRSRRALAKLSVEQLADIGITRQQAEDEAARPLWDAPAHWHGK
jgi:uncharacterized protein YjiS (DUF1127 family)